MAELKLSESEEMYLITIAKLGERGVEGPVPLSMLAEELAVQPVSANQMIHKLEQDGIVSYLPYKGVSLQNDGQRLVHRTLRRRRLWELFLVEHLGLSFAAADQLACRMEHISSQEVTERLSAFLGHPTRSSQGDPIPPAENAALTKAKVLSAIEAGAAGRVLQIEDESLAQFLEAQGIQAGVLVEVLANAGGRLLLSAGAERIQLAAEAADEIRVEMVEQLLKRTAQ